MRLLKLYIDPRFPSYYWLYYFHSTEDKTVKITNLIGHDIGEHTTDWQSIGQAVDYNINTLEAKEVFLKSCCPGYPSIWNYDLNQWTCFKCEKKVEYTEEQLEFATVTTLKPSPSCDCGGEKAKTTHAFYCSAYKP